MIAVFYVITFNTIATFTVKVYQCASSKGSANKPHSSQTATVVRESLLPAKPGNFNAPDVGENPKLPQSSALVKSVGGLKGMFGENRKYFLCAKESYNLNLYPAVKVNVEDKKANASSVGYCWNATHANAFEVLVHSPTEFKIKIDAESYHVTFGDEGVAKVWNAYFQVIILAMLHFHQPL